MSKQRWMYILFMLAGVALYVLIIISVLQSNVLAVIFLALLVSPVTFGLLAWQFEGGLFRVYEVFDPRIQSWAFLSDLFVFPATLAFAALARKQVSEPNLSTNVYWHVISVAVAVAVAVGFHFVDKDSYDDEQLQSPTKVWHDWVTYPVLASALMVVAMPLLANFNSYASAILVLIFSWIGLCIWDGFRPLDPQKLHIRWNVEKFMPQ